jgi:hypothetical protein
MRVTMQMAEDMTSSAVNQVQQTQSGTVPTVLAKQVA